MGTIGRLAERLKQAWGDGTSARAELFRGTVGAFIVNCLGVLAVFGLQAALVRSLGFSGYGRYEFVLSCLSILVILATFGFDGVLLRFVPAYIGQNEAAKLRGLLRYSAMVVCGLSLLVGVLSVAGTSLLGTYFERLHRELDLFWVGTILIPIWSLNSLRQYALRGLKRAVWARLPDIVIRPVIFSCLLILSVQQADGAVIRPETAMLFHISAAGVVFLIGSWLLGQAIPPSVRASSPVIQGKYWLGLGWSFVLVTAMHSLLAELDKIMLGLLGTTEMVGLYSLAARLGLLVMFVAEAVQAIGAPLIAEFYAGRSKEELQKLVYKVTWWMFLGGLPIFVALFFGGAWILGIFGPEFEEAHIVLITLSLGQLLALGVGPSGYLLTMTGNHRILPRVLVSTLVINLGLNVPGILMFGSIGAALATAIALVVRSCMLFTAVRRETGVDSSIFGAAKFFLIKKSVG